MDKSWMNKSRLSNEYDEGVHAFLNFAFLSAGDEQKIVCPCVNCKLVIPIIREVAYEHLICDGFVEGYTKWELHGEGPSCASPQIETDDHNNLDMDMDIDIDRHGLFHDAMGIRENVGEDAIRAFEDEGDRPNPKAELFYRLVGESEKELYPGCKNYTMLSFVVRLYDIKCLGGFSDSHFNMLFELIKTALPEGENLPKSIYEMKRLIKQLGLSYEKIHACPNDCILYRNEHKDDVECHVYKRSTYVRPEDMSLTKKCSNVPVLRYFPLIPRLQRLFMSSKNAPFMKWHKDDRTFDGHLRSHRQVMVSNVILSMIIPGPSAPGNDMDVYLQPLVDELKVLWETGINTYDASTKRNFNLRAAILWTISDLPAYANLSGWSQR